MTVGESLQRFRAEFNLSQKEVSETLGMVPQAYYRYETGKYFPRADNLIVLAEKYNVSVDYLLGLTDEPRLKPQEVRDKEFYDRVSATVTELQEAVRKAGTNHSRHVETADKNDFAAYNEETIRAIEDVEHGVGVSREFSSIDELMEDLTKNA